MVSSTAGVQQGDNLGPLLFAATIHSMLGELKAMMGIDLVIGYLDDIVVAGESEAVLRALLLLHITIPSLGLTLNMAKCELIPLAGPLCTSNLSLFRHRCPEFIPDGSNFLVRRLVTESSPQASSRTNVQLKRMVCSLKSLELRTPK